MKKIIKKLKKCLCLTLSIFLLASNVQVFGQEIPIMSYIESMSEFDKDIESLRKIFQGIEEHYANPKKALGGLWSHFFDYARDFETKYTNFMNVNIKNYEYIKEYAINNNYEDIVKILSEEQSFIDQKIIKLEELLPKDAVQIKVSGTRSERLIEEAKSKKYSAYSIGYDETVAVWIKDEDVVKIKGYIEHYREEIERMSKIGNLNTKVRNQIVREHITPADILEYTYKTGMLPKEKAGVKLTLEAMDADVSVASLVKSIRSYLTEFGTKIKDVKYYPVASLTRELNGMTLAERTQYVNELTELNSGSKAFIKDLNELDRPTKRYVGKSITKGNWALPLIGSILVAATITELRAENNFSASANLPLMKKKIEDGEASPAEKWQFYTNKRTEELVKTDPVHTLNFVQLASQAYQEEQALEEKVAEEENNKVQLNDTINTMIINGYNNSGELIKNLNIGSLE